MEKITYSHFKKLLTCQPYFVWNTYKYVEQEEDADDENEEEGFDFFLGDEILDGATVSISEIQVKSFGLIENIFLMHEASNPGDKVIIGKTLEEKEKYLRLALEDNSVKRLIKPTFSYKVNEEQVAIASPFIYDKNAKTVYFLKLSASTKKADLLKVFWDCWVMEKCGIEIKDIQLIILATQNYEKGEINFFYTNKVRFSSTENADVKAAKQILKFPTLQDFKAGLLNDNIPTIFDIYTSKQIPAPRFNADKPVYIDEMFDLDYYIERINLAKSSTLSYPQEADNTHWGKNPAWNDLVKKFAPHFEGFSGNIIKKDAIISDLLIKDISLGIDVTIEIDKNKPTNKLKPQSNTLAQIINNTNPVINDIDWVREFIAPLEGKVVWYDFEAFAIPICPLSMYLPFQQTISQVSIIRTEGLDQIDDGTDNIVIDPYNINHDDLFMIIKSIYWPGAKYVVYNKSYENSRLKEMVRIFKALDKPYAEKAEQMVVDIIDNTIDLADVFSCSAKQPAKIQIPYLKGKHSIKLLEKYITNERTDVQYKIKEYKKLEVQNGMMAMELANNRAFGIVQDSTWAVKVPKLKEYCENDVRAMIMVYHLIKELIK